MASSTEFEDLKQSVTQILSDIVCRICGNRPRPGKTKWYRCLNLHQICQDCCFSYCYRENCGDYCTCDEPFSNVFCKLTEDLLNVKGLKFPCKNRKNGCLETCSENTLEDHEAECIFRYVPCPFSAMYEEFEAQVIVQDVIQHFEEEHFEIEELVEKDRHTHQYGDEDFYGTYPKKLERSGKTFILAGAIKDKIHYRWVYIMGSPNEAKHFSYTFKYFGKNSSVFTFEGKVAAIDETFDTLMEAGKCFTITQKVFEKQILDEDRKYEYSLQIRNLKEEVKDDNYESGISDNDEDSKE